MVDLYDCRYGDQIKQIEIFLRVFGWTSPDIARVSAESQ